MVPAAIVRLLLAHNPHPVSFLPGHRSEEHDYHKNVLFLLLRPSRFSLARLPAARHLHAVGSQRGLARFRAQEQLGSASWPRNDWALSYLIVAVLLVLSNVTVRLPVSRWYLPFGHVRVEADAAPGQHPAHPARQLRRAIRSFRRSPHRLGLSWLHLNAQLNALFAAQMVQVCYFASVCSSLAAHTSKHVNASDCSIMWVAAVTHIKILAR